MGVELRGQSATLGEVLTERGDHGRMLGEGEAVLRRNPLAPGAGSEGWRGVVLGAIPPVAFLPFSGDQIR